MAQIYKIEIFKHLKGKSTHEEWSNVYHVLDDSEFADVTSDRLDADCLSLLQMERNFHFETVQFDRGVISTYFPDEAGEKEIVRTIGYGDLGIRQLVLTDEMIPMTNVLAVSMSPKGGRQSIRTYRGALSDLSTARYDGEIILGINEANTITQGIYQALRGPGTLDRLVVPSVRNGVVAARHIHSIAVNGVRQRQRFQKKTPRVSYDEDAIRKRMEDAARELQFIIASMTTFDQFKDYKKLALAQKALEQLHESCNMMIGTTIEEIPKP